ncbi:MAG: zinc-dependent metalloprotease [Deltaproteobacteria bacterium]|nr:zinc-dependent metalloprotease [Deltaproteobacteria bacterium]
MTTNSTNIHSSTGIGATSMKATKLGLALVAATLAGALASTGCGPAIDINRVAPNVVDKSTFQGEWYFRSTVIDKQFHTAGTFIGYEGGLERITWEITEGALVAYRSYEKIPGSDPSNPGESHVLAAFPVTKHFDIRRGYNPVNGVENNTIEENDSDRPWWQRDYMHVDWSKNVGPSFDQAAGDLECWYDEYDNIVCQVGGMNGVNRNSNNDPAYPYKVRISEDYVETTIDTQQMPDPYYCYLLDGMSPCNAAMVKMKLSFMKIDPANDYLPLNYPDFSEVATGTLVRDDNDEVIATSVANTAGQYNPRMCVNDEVGPDGKGIFLVVEEGDLTRMCNTDAFGGDDPTDCVEIVARCDGMEELWYASGPEDVGVECDTSIHDPDDCYQITLPVFSRFGFFRTDRYVQDREDGFTLHARERLINRWNIWQRSRAEDGSPLPMAVREPKPVVYHLNVTFPPEMLPSVDALETDWDVAFRSAVASAKGVPLSEVTQQMFDIRVNDCNIEHVNAVADELDLVDALRANNIDEVGIGNLENACAVLEHETMKLHFNDPNVPVFTWQQLGDLRYSFLNWTPKAELAGPLGYGPSAADPITGQIVSANANIYGTSLDTYANWGADIVQLINGEISDLDVMNGTNVREHIEAVRNRWSEKTPQAQVDAFKNLFDERTAFMSDEQYFKQIPLTAVNEGMDRLAQTDIEETFLIDGEMVRLFGGDPRAAAEGRVTADMLAKARPSSWARQHVPQEALVAANAAMSDLEGKYPGSPAGMLGAASKLDELSDYLGRKNFCFLAQQVEPAVADLASRIATEGLDREQMVQRIREQVFIGVTAHELGHTFGLRHNFSGSADAVNFFPEFWGVTDLPGEQDHLHAKNGMSSRFETGYSSIMDYHQRFNSDWAGIGLYDKAAIKRGYAEMAEVFDETEGNFVARDWIDSATFLLDPYDLPRVLGGANANDRINDEYTRTYNDYVAGDEGATMDVAGDAGIVPHPENIFRRRDIPWHDFMRNEVLSLYIGSITDTDLLSDYGLLDDDGRAPKVAVPYDFCSDAYAWGGGLTCNRYDQGITSSEIVQNAGQMYEFYYPFNNFRRERVLSSYGSWVNGYLSRLFSRTYQPMLNSFRYFYYYRRSSARLFPGVNDWGTAALQGMNFFARVLQTPEPGTYCMSGTTYVPEGQASDCTDSVELSLGQGRYYNSSWDSEYIYNPSNLGMFWDKAIAIQALTDSEAFFFRDFSSYTNRGAFSIGYYRVFAPEMLKLFGGLIGGDTSTYSPVVITGDNGAEVVYRPFLTTDVLGNVITPDPRLVEGDPLQAATSYQLKYYAAVFGMFNLTSTLDQNMDFAQRTRIRLAGSASDPTIDTTVVDPANIRTFTDPVAGVVYRSVAVDGPDNSIGFKLLDAAQSFADNEWVDAKDALAAAEAGGDAEAIRAAEVDFRAKDAELADKVQIIDFLVLLGDELEFPF